jgi:alkylhydroperoxidase/carboxymuconolactone decarboxylase family protein YurZ
MSEQAGPTPMDRLRAISCTLMWTRLAKQAGVTEAEIAEAILVSR